MINPKSTPLLLIILGVLTGCSGSHLIVKDHGNLELCQCLPLPDCVSSDSWVPYNHIAPFELAVPSDKAWDAIREAVSTMPRTQIVEERPGYIHAECRSLVFRFVDNLELLLDPGTGIVSVRSSSVLGLFDFGVNYWRVRNLRHMLAEKGIIK